MNPLLQVCYLYRTGLYLTLDVCKPLGARGTLPLQLFLNSYTLSLELRERSRPLGLTGSSIFLQPHSNSRTLFLEDSQNSCSLGLSVLDSAEPFNESTLLGLEAVPLADNLSQPDQENHCDRAGKGKQRQECACHGKLLDS